VPRNPAVIAVEKARAAERNYRAAERALKSATKARKAAMVRCVEAGISKAEVGRIFGVGRNAIGNVVGPAIKLPPE
jgi:hypothetical protein